MELVIWRATEGARPACQLNCMVPLGWLTRIQGSSAKRSSRIGTLNAPSAPIGIGIQPDLASMEAVMSLHLTSGRVERICRTRARLVWTRPSSNCDFCMARSSW